MSIETPQRRRLPRALLWLAVPIVVLGIVFAWWTISPLFRNTRVDEAFPAAAPTAIAEAPTAIAEAPTAIAEAPTAMAEAPTAIAEAPTAMAEAPTAIAEAPTAMAEAPTAIAEAPTAMAEAPTAAPVEPVALASGSFTFIDNLHWAEGTATIYSLADGSHVLRLEPFTAQNGPDLFVGLSGHPMPRSSAEAHDSGYVELERLKANQGNQNYAIPAALDLSAFRSVVIYCKAFSVVFSTAELVQ
jgi:hypothetical protein